MAYLAKLDITVIPLLLFFIKLTSKITIQLKLLIYLKT